jgi:hypothetical protein
MTTPPDAPPGPVPATWLFGWRRSTWNLIISAGLVAALCLQSIGIWQQAAERRELVKQLDCMLQRLEAQNAR